MFNLLMKPKPWIAASLLIAASAFGFGKSNNSQNCHEQCPKAKRACKEKPCPQPNPPTQLCEKKPDPCCPAWPVPVLNAAYNYPAGTKTRNPCNIAFDVSFTYWEPTQENMELGVDVVGTAATVINPDFDYTPGFKVGVGGKFDYDNWDVRGEYTWLHDTTTTFYAATAGVIETLNGSPAAVGITATAADQSWRLRMDIGELTLGRWHYLGTKLTVHPTVGLRGAWIRQNLTDTYSLAGATTNVLSARSSSWALGPQVGLDANWACWKGLRFYGNAEADILYTRYTNLSSTNAASTVSQGAYGLLRTHLDLELGLGWGMYLDCNKWYLDFTAGYGFQVFFDQNMFRRFAQVDSGTGPYTSVSPTGNLYVQGLTLTAKVDF